MRAWPFLAAAVIVAAIVFGLARYLNNDYLFFAGYTVIQFIVLATAWNILGGYCGYVNFGSAAFFAVCAYSAVALHKVGMSVDRGPPDVLAPLMKFLLPLPIPVLIVIGGIIAGII